MEVPRPSPPLCVRCLGCGHQFGFGSLSTSPDSFYVLSAFLLPVHPGVLSVLWYPLQWSSFPPVDRKRPPSPVFYIGSFSDFSPSIPLRHLCFRRSADYPVKRSTAKNSSVEVSWSELPGEVGVRYHQNRDGDLLIHWALSSEGTHPDRDSIRL